MTCTEDAGHLHGFRMEYGTSFHVGDDWVYPVKTESAVVDNTDPIKQLAILVLLDRSYEESYPYVWNLHCGGS